MATPYSKKEWVDVIEKDCTKTDWSRMKATIEELETTKEKLSLLTGNYLRLNHMVEKFLNAYTYLK